MQAPIELALESPDGLVDCRIEQVDEDNVLVYSVTILYPHLVNGRIQSKVYEHNLNLNPATGLYYFADEGMVHPKVYLLECRLSAAIKSA